MHHQLARLAAAAKPLSPASAAAAARRLVCSSRTTAMGHGSHSSDNDPQVLEREKARSLTGQTPEIVPGAPGWNPGVASDSEAVVKAERAPSLPMEELQEQTIKMVQHLHDGGEHPGVLDEVPNPSEAPAIRENLKHSQDTLRDGQGANPL